MKRKSVSGKKKKRRSVNEKNNNKKRIGKTAMMMTTLENGNNCYNPARVPILLRKLKRKRSEKKAYGVVSVGISSRIGSQISVFGYYCYFNL